MLTYSYSPTKVKFMSTLPRHEPLVQDHSSIKILKDCYRKYFYRIVLGRVPSAAKNQTVLDFGKEYHKFRELLETDGFMIAMSYVLTESKITPAPQGNKFEYLNHERLVKTCKVAYDHWLKEKNLGKIEVIAVEQPFNITMPDGSIIGGRADQIVKWNGRLWGRDFKTTSKDQLEFSKQLEPNDQAMRYIYMESALHGEMIQGIIFEAIYNTKTVGPKIYSVPSTRTKYQIDQWVKEQTTHNRILNVLRESDEWPMCEDHGCNWCDYRDVCKAPTESSAENILRSSRFKLSPWDSTKVEQTEL